MGTSITTSILTAEAGIAVGITPRAFVEAAFMPGTDTRRRRADALVTVSAAVEEFMAAGSREAEAASMVAAVVGLEVEGTAAKVGGLAYKQC